MDELIRSNKQEMMKDSKTLDFIEEKVEKKHAKSDNKKSSIKKLIFKT
ncbi:FbpB family small basic protein [Metabacillus sp. RGM 3146]